MENENILIVSPSNNFSEQSRKVLAMMGHNFKILQIAGKNVLTEVEKVLAEHKVYAVVTRGYNVAILRENLSIPIVDVRYTFEDIYYSYQAASEFSDRIAFISIDVAKEKALTFQAITNNQLFIPDLKSPEEIPACINLLSKKGYGVFVGGMTTERAAKENGVKSIDIFVEERSIETALKETIHLVQLNKERSKNQAFIENILEATENGMIAVSKDAKTIYTNKKAKLFFESELDLFIDSVLHKFIKDNPDSDYSLINQIINFNHQNFILNISPIISQAATTGYLASVEKLDVLQAKEGDVRNKLSQKMNTAKKSFDHLIGNSSTLQETIRQAKKFSKTESAVLIEGETGTGKEVFAQGIHNHSPRQHEPFIAINCAALSENVLESELFGYVKGAFTGATTEGKIGIFEAAHKGTIFLDEIGEISLSFQAKLLRVLQEKEITRLGDTKTIPVDVRIISATNRNLVKMVEQREFREDLYYRLDVLHLKLPPLRARQEDIKDLTLSFLNQSKKTLKISTAALDLLATYHFPGNIRQLQNIAERMMALCEDSRIDAPLVRSILENEPHFLKTTELNTESSSISDVEKQLITRTLIKYNNNKTLAAEELQISKSTLWRKLKSYGLQ